MCDFYIKKKFRVIGLDNLLTGNYYNLSHIIDNSNFEFYEYDICKKIKVKTKIDYVMHFASPASPVDYLKYPIKTLQTGSIGTENILKLALKNKAKVLVASSSEVYGDPEIHPQTESYFGNVNTIGPRGVYDEAKRYLEAITMAYKNKKKLNVSIARIFNTYGPRMRVQDGRAIPNFINQALKNNPITIYGDGSQTRSFCYISDTIKALSKLLHSNYYLPMNIGNPKEYSINQLATLIKKLTTSNSKISFHDLPENDPKVRKPNIELAKKKLNWEPKIDLYDGLTKTTNYYINLYNLEK